MALEIEHKFLVVSEEWRSQVFESKIIRQGYLSNNPQASVRVRIEGQEANINIKGMTLGIQRLEYEYPIPFAQANELLDKLCTKPLIDKTRHLVEFAGKRWEIDEFTGENEGLIVAELELKQVGEIFEKPAWAGEEVSGIVRYYNVSLQKYPFSDWTEAERQGKNA